MPSGESVALLFLTFAVLYAIFMSFGALIVRVPADGWKPAGFDPSTVKQKALVTTDNVSADNAIRTPQFWLLWIVLFCNVTAGIGILEQAAPMIQDFFRDGETSAVAAATAAGFVGLLSLFNMGGRFVWSSTSDYIGRKPIYMIYLGVGIVLYVILATLGSSATWIFVLTAAVIISFYGGGFATIPAYLRDLFGTFQVGAIHGRLLTAWSAAGVVGPLIVNGFLDAAGHPGNLVASDYRPALLTMVAILVVGFVANLLNELQCGRCGTGAQLAAIGQDQRFVPCPALLALGHAHQQHILDSQIRQCGLGLGQLAGAAIDQQHVGQYAVFFHRATEPALDRLAHGGVVVAGGDAGNVEAPVLPAHGAAGVEHHARGHRGFAHGVADVEAFDAQIVQVVGRQIERLGQRARRLDHVARNWAHDFTPGRTTTLHCCSGSASAANVMLSGS